MTWKMLAAILLGLTVGVAIPSHQWTQGAQAQRPEKAQQCEYKVVPFIGVGSAIKNHEEKLNQLTADGWEYIGLLSIRVAWWRSSEPRNSAVWATRSGSFLVVLTVLMGLQSGS